MVKKTPNPAAKKAAPRARANGAAKRPRGAGRDPIYAAPVSLSQAQRFPGNGRGMKSHRFSNSELVQSLSESSAFTATKLRVNPGLAATFPWLSVEASKWEQYRFHRLCFRYVTRTSTATVGSVILSPDYSLRDLPPTTEAQASNTQDAVEDAVWREISCELDVNAMYPSGPRKLIRSANVAGDPNLYDSANMYICTVEGAGTAAIGKIWVDYDVELFVPQNSPSDGSTSSVSVSYGARATSATFVTATPTAVDFDALTSDPLGIGNDTAGVFTPAAGTYRIDFGASFADSSAEAFTVLVEIWKNGAALSPQAARSSILTVAAGGRVSIAVSGIASFSGTDTCQIEVTLTGAAGTLTMTTASSYIIFSQA